MVSIEIISKGLRITEDTARAIASYGRNHVQSHANGLLDSALYFEMTNKPKEYVDSYLADAAYLENLIEHCVKD